MNGFFWTKNKLLTVVSGAALLGALVTVVGARLLHTGAGHTPLPVWSVWEQMAVVLALPGALVATAIPGEGAAWLSTPRCAISGAIVWSLSSVVLVIMIKAILDIVESRHRPTR